MSPESGSMDRRPYLICYDGSPDALAAIARAGTILGGGPALVAYAWLPPSAIMLQGRLLETSHPLAPATAEFDAAAEQEAKRVAAQGASHANDAGFEAEPTTVRASYGLWRELLGVADQHHARAIIVGSHGWTRFESTLLGSVSRRIVDHSSRPVLVVPGGEGHAREPTEG